MQEFLVGWGEGSATLRVLAVALWWPQRDGGLQMSAWLWPVLGKQSGGVAQLREDGCSSPGHAGRYKVLCTSALAIVLEYEFDFAMLRNRI